MSFIYPRVVAISRPRVTTTAGVQPFQEFTPAQETTVATGLQASIQQDRDGGKPLAGVPGDTRARGVWKIFVQKFAAAAASLDAPGAIQDRDFITDDAGARYQVTHNYWNSLGWNLKCERLEA